MFRLKIIARLLLIAVFVSVHILPPGIVFASEIKKHQTPSFREKLVSKAYGVCSEVLSSPKEVAIKMASAAMIFPVPMTPLVRTWRDPNRRFFVFLESPLIGAITTPLSTVIARGIAHLVTDSPFLENLGQHTAEAYVSYNGVNVVRQGITLDPSLKLKTKILINYFYSVLIYSLFTAGAHLPQALSFLSGAANTMSAEEVSQGAYALSLVGYAWMWPILSQKISTRTITPFLAKSFIEKDLLDALNEVKSETDANSLLRQLKDSVDRADNLDKENVTRKYYWAKWVLRGVEAGDPIPFYLTKSFKKNHPPLGAKGYWALKTSFTGAIAVGMTVLYFLLRYAGVGTGTEDLSLLPNVILSISGNE